MENWQSYKISDFLEINPSVKLSPKNEYSFVEMKDLNDGVKYVQPSQFKELKGGSRFQEKDTLFARITPCLENGKICQVKNLEHEVGFGSTEFLVFRGKKGISDTDFVYYLSRSQIFRNFAEQNMVGTSGRQRVSKDVFSNLELKLPPLPTQKAIAEILSSLDDKIELNNQINRNLEALAQALFKQWFVDFEFPNENGEPYKSSGGEMVDSELGEVPKGWKASIVKEEFHLNMGQSPKSETYNENGEGKIFFQGKTDFGFRFPSIRLFTTDPKKIARKGETLISVRAPVGDINRALKECCIGRGLGAIQEKNNYQSYTYYKILSIQTELKSYDNEGTVFGSINKETLGAIKTIIPSKVIAGKFDKMIKPIDDQIEVLSKEVESIKSMRDLILPKLISGELEVSQLKKEVYG